MSNNPKIMIALAFVLTFLIGIGAGYLVRGQMQVSSADQEVLSREGRQYYGSQTDESRSEREDRAGRMDRDERSERSFGLRSERRDGSGWRQSNVDANRQPDRMQNAERDSEAGLNQSQRAEPRDRPDYGRIKERLQRELKLSDECAEEFFSVLEGHRNKVREEIVEKQREIREQYQELRTQLEEELSRVLSPEQMDIWQEKFAPRMDRRHQAREEDDR